MGHRRTGKVRATEMGSGHPATEMRADAHCADMADAAMPATAETASGEHGRRKCNGRPDRRRDEANEKPVVHRRSSLHCGAMPREEVR
jgi:hypothetical protein